MAIPATDRGGASRPGLEDALLASPLLGGALADDAERHLQRAALSYHLTDVAETHLRAAHVLAPDHAAVLIAFYRFYFYKGRLFEALQMARACIRKALQENRLPPDWRMVRASDAPFGEWEALVPRFFLFSLKGYAYLSMRLGDLAEGRLAVEKLLELDARDRIGARVLLDVLDRMDREPDDA
jgi:tetratricopeptide (TPR) repeat protein